jgi:hypothetical protein
MEIIKKKVKGRGYGNPEKMKDTFGIAGNTERKMVCDFAANVHILYCYFFYCFKCVWFCSILKVVFQMIVCEEKRRDPFTQRVNTSHFMCWEKWNLIQQLIIETLSISRSFPQLWFQFSSQGLACVRPIKESCNRQSFEFCESVPLFEMSTLKIEG